MLQKVQNCNDKLKIAIVKILKNSLAIEITIFIVYSIMSASLSFSYYN
jgi:hypothetical protein